MSAEQSAAERATSGSFSSTSQSLPGRTTELHQAGVSAADPLRPSGQ